MHGIGRRPSRRGLLPGPSLRPAGVREAGGPAPGEEGHGHHDGHQAHLDQQQSPVRRARQGAHGADLPPGLVDPGRHEHAHRRERGPGEALDRRPPHRRARPQRGQQGGQSAQPDRDGQQVRHVDRHRQPGLEARRRVLGHRPGRRQAGRDDGAADAQPVGDVPPGTARADPVLAGVRAEEHRHEHRCRAEQQQPRQQRRARFCRQGAAEQRQVDDGAHSLAARVRAAQQQQRRRRQEQRDPAAHRDPLHRAGRAAHTGEDAAADEQGEARVRRVPADAVEGGDGRIGLRGHRVHGDRRLRRRADGEGEGPGHRVAVRRDRLPRHRVRAVGDAGAQADGRRLGPAGLVTRAAVVDALAARVEDPYRIRV